MVGGELKQIAQGRGWRLTRRNSKAHYFEPSPTNPYFYTSLCGLDRMVHNSWPAASWADQCQTCVKIQLKD